MTISSDQTSRPVIRPPDQQVRRPYVGRARHDPLSFFFATSFNRRGPRKKKRASRGKQSRAEQSRAEQSRGDGPLLLRRKTSNIPSRLTKASFAAGWTVLSRAWPAFSLVRTQNHLVIIGKDYLPSRCLPTYLLPRCSIRQILATKTYSQCFLRRSTPQSAVRPSLPTRQCPKTSAYMVTP